mmetsp:Transcript_17021/g.59563  ORF Transcript_17021/g.59563 Transcript_17021/m.59563 type:complete len:151 (-) Transcript_17021:68-520(-)
MTDRTAVPWEELYRAGPCVYPSSKELPTVLADFIDQLERLDLSFSKIEESEKHTAIIALLFFVHDTVHSSIATEGLWSICLTRPPDEWFHTTRIRPEQHRPSHAATEGLAPTKSGDGCMVLECHAGFLRCGCIVHNGWSCESLAHIFSVK